MAKNLMNRAVFLDRDGTIARDVHYCSRPEDLELLPTVGEGIRLLNEAEFKVVVITNQSGIARGYFTEEMLGKIHQKMINDLARYGAHIDAIYYCPHHPDEGCECRKPKPKLAYQAIKDLQIDSQQSYVIGDRLMDVQLARAVGCKSVMISSDPGRSELEDCDILPDYIGSDFESAARWIMQQQSNLVSRRYRG